MIPFDMIHITALVPAITLGSYCIWTYRNQTKMLKSIKELLECTPDILIICEADGTIIYTNKKVFNLLGYTSEELKTKRITELLQVQFSDTMPLSPQLFHGKEFLIQTKFGEKILFETSISFTSGDDAKFLIALRNITTRKKDESVIYHLAYYDTLTGFPNRLQFNEQSDKILSEAEKQGKKLALFLIDLDDFKRINDTFGHLAGDDLLKEIAIRLQFVINSRCSVEQQCSCFGARLGGDEFVLIIEHIESTEYASSVAEHIFKQFRTPIIVDNHEVFAKFSIGIGLYPHDGTTVSTLLKSADLALYAAKDKGKNQYHFHEQEMNTKLVDYFQYERALHYFIETGDFTMAYQPIINLDNNTVCGVEALFRGNVEKYPDIKFERTINIAEETGLILLLGNSILKKACNDCVKFLEQNPKMYVSVNISIRELNEDDFVEKISAALTESNLPPNRLALEVTESLFMLNFKENIRKLKKLKDMGICISVDDFGKGHSSMSHLRQLPVDRLKIDKEFIEQIVTDKKSEEIVRGITLIAQTLGMIVCAEGVETEEQFKKLKDIGVDQVQGYLTGHPVSFEKLVNNTKEKTK